MIQYPGYTTRVLFIIVCQISKTLSKIILFFCPTGDIRIRKGRKIPIMKIFLEVEFPESKLFFTSIEGSV
jgi:hypothetical protein